MDYLIFGTLVLLLGYMVIRDIIINRRRRKNHLLLKRISRKFDTTNKQITENNRLFKVLLKVLSEEKVD